MMLSGTISEMLHVVILSLRPLRLCGEIKTNRKACQERKAIKLVSGNLAYPAIYSISAAAGVFL
ncbi:MAG: hypothetical protein Q7U60_00345 [Candidatus Methanoperedens sp.]|nr:hypothetical protein [Candidatus Methanoperedens sp.]